MGDQLKRCFVVSPIGLEGSVERKHSDLVLNYIIKPVLECKFEYDVRRGDDVGHTGMITVDVINSIFDSELVIADLSFLNPNVFYELGLRHSTESPVIHIAARGTNLPFDNADHRTIFFDLSDWGSQEIARDELTKKVEAIERNAGASNPATLARTHKKVGEFADTITALNGFIGQLEDRITQVASQIAEPPPKGHVTRDYYKTITENHRDEILQVVKSIRRKIDLRGKSTDERPPVQVSDLLRRLGAIEKIVLTQHPVMYLPESATQQ